MTEGSVGALVLAGGRSRRMGRDKATLAARDSDPETLLARTTRVALEVASQCVVVLAPEQLAPGLDARARIVRDPTPYDGPLAAIAHAFEHLRTDWVLVLATDHPRLCRAVLARIATLAEGDGAAIDGEPFLAVYRANALGAATRELVRDGERRARSLLDRLAVRLIQKADLLSDPDVALEDPTLASLRDVDTPADLEGLSGS